MNDTEMMERISLNPQVMVGKPVVTGTRLSVEYILSLLAHGNTADQIIEEYQGLTQQDIQACLLFAARALQDTTFMPLTPDKA